MKKIKFCTIISFMKLFYIEKDAFLNNNGKELIKPFINSEIKSIKKRTDNAIGRYITDCVLKNVYKKENYEIIKVKNKPQLKDNDIHFNISHSDNIILAAFDDSPIGIDIEMKKVRDLKKLRKRYNKNFKTLDDFYAFWTQYEAVLKLQDKAQKVISFDFKHYYKITVASCKKAIDFKVYNLN